MIIIGHRGAMGHAPENTLVSFEKALEMGVDWVELDVYAVEGELVVIHDSTLDRTTNGRGKVSAHSLTELRALDAGGGQRIPLLSEVFDLINGRVGINVELKGPATAAPVVAFLEEQLADGWSVDQLVLSSFDHRQLQAARQLNPEIPRAALYFGRQPDYSFIIDELDVVGVNPHLSGVDEGLVQSAHDYGLQVWVYTVNEPADMARMKALNVDGIFTNYPDRARGLDD